MKGVWIVVLTAAVALIATGCNTVQGIGKDIERGGAAIQKAADK
ncbi:MAG: entericidin A/B family lipoprotein [Rhodocyclaceae bacterium]|jgi:predicted small secreted protein|nr:entericidin A/B family lipoprotein [Rhodocyclaceae bacterium]